MKQPYFNLSSLLERGRILLPVTLALSLLLVMSVFAQSGGPYDLTQFTVSGGGGTSSGEGYALSGTAGQPDAGVLAGGGYVLGGGFWSGGAVVVEYDIYLPLVLKHYL